MWDRNTTTVYRSVYETVNGSSVERTAESLGGQYLFTATLQKISVEKYADITFRVTPYVVKAGEKIRSAVVTFALDDGNKTYYAADQALLATKGQDITNYR